MSVDRLAAPSLLSQQNRLIRIDTPLDEAALVVVRFAGREAISENFRFEIDCASTSAMLKVGALIGEEVSLRLLLADGALRSWHGHVTVALQLGADGGLASYRLVLEPWLAFLGQRRDCFVFQDKALPAILEEIFADYVEANWRMDSAQLFRPRALCVQYRETDLAFVMRLLAEEGLSFRFEHAAGQKGGQSRRARHTLVIFDRDAELPNASQALVRFHRVDAPEEDDTISELTESRQAGVNSLVLSSWDETQLRATGAEAVGAGANGDLPPMQFFAGASLRTFDESAAAELCASLQLAAHEAHYRSFEGRGAVREMAAGTVFSLAGHDSLVGEAARFTVIEVEHRAANNLGAQVARLLDAVEIERGSYRNSFALGLAATPLVPQPIAKPAALLQTALVTGRPGARLTTERNHRVRIQFPWQRGEAPNAGGLSDTGPAGSPGNAPGDDRCGIWVRVAEWLAGPDWGSHFLPRIGTEVLVDFIDGDIDRPLIVGQLYNGQDLPPFSAGVDSAANHPGVLSGWTSYNFEAGYNQWLIDDAPAQLRTRLSSSQGSGQLGLGHLIHQQAFSATRGAWRGSGFELRTDAWLAVRAGEGMLISSSARPQAQSTQMDVAQALAQLRAAGHAAQALSDAAEGQAALPLDACAAQREFIDALDPQVTGRYQGRVGGQEARKAEPGARSLGAPVERFAEPSILTEGPDDIGFSSPASSLVYAGTHVHATAQQDFHGASGYTFSAAVGESASWFAHSGGIRSIAAAGSLSVQAHSDAMEILADQSVTVSSSKEEIQILASEQIVLKAGESSVTIKGGDITFACPGTFSVKGAGNAFEGPSKNPRIPEHMPFESVIPKEIFSLKLQTQFAGQSLSGKGYALEIDGQMFEGTLSSNGEVFAPVSRTPRAGTLSVWPYGKDSRPWTWRLDLKKQRPPDEYTGIQSRLKNLGLYRGEIDGAFGAKTRAALRRFQEWQGIPSTSDPSAVALSLLVGRHDT